MKKYVFILLILVSNALQAQSVAELTQRITAEKTTDSAKVTAIYDWLTQNVRYDNALKFRRSDDTVLWQEPYNVVRHRKAVCMGYAKTFREMCRLSGVESLVVEGWAKSASGYLEREGHAWNIVKINDIWYPLDATWDAGEVQQPKKYFLSPPSVFIANHMPHDPMFQLLNPTMSLVCFTKNKNCEISTAQSFNFSDTIRLWQSLDTAQKLYNQAIRTLNFNAYDLIAIRDLADYYGQEAATTYAAYNEIRKSVAEKKRPAKDKSAVLALLEKAINLIKAAQKQYETLAQLSKNGLYSDAYLNAQLLEETLDNLLKEKEFVNQYFKN
jgi:Transglutaminase-like superfamily